MNGNVQRRSSRSSSLAQSPTNHDDDCDAISLTSTVEPEDPPETEYVVEGIHAERELEIDGDRHPRFLVEWANFPLDQCTWEPLENLTKELMAQWEEKKAAQNPSVALEFEERYNAAFNAALEAARQRHRWRNAKRKRLGLLTTSFWFRGQHQSDSEIDVVSADEAPDSEAEQFTPSSGGDNDSDEADENNAVNHKAIKDSGLAKFSSKAKLPKPPRPSSRVFTFDPDKTETSVNAKSREAALPKSPSQTLTRPSSSKESQGNNMKAQPSKQSSRDRGLSSATGYQGSALKPYTGDCLSSRPVNASDPKAAILPSASVPAPIPAATAPLEIAKKTLTGRKTARTTAPINIFSEGKKAKTKQSLRETEIDNKHAPKIYSKHNHRRKAEMRSRDRNDQAPDISKIAGIMFIPGSNAEHTQAAPQEQASPGLGDKEVESEANANKSQWKPSTMSPIGIDSAGNADSAPDVVQSAGPLKRSSISSGQSSNKAKRVHFTEVEGLFVDEPQPMDIDSTSNSSRDVSVDIPSSATAGAMELSISTYESRNLPVEQSVGKKMKLSTAPENVLDVVFSGIPRAGSVHTAQEWLNDFLNTSSIDMGHVVLAETLIVQLPSLSSQGLQRLCSGTVTSTTNSKDLDILAEHLRVGSSGLFAANARFNLLVFPTKCADFNSLSTFGVEPIGPDGASLKYFMFSSSLPIFQHIRPCSSTVMGLEARVGQEKVLLFPTILGIQYSALTASPDKDKNKPVHFFLAFPQRATEWQQSIASWLSTRDRTCKIYTNSYRGSWLAFVEKARKERGVVIVHEALVPFLRRFPQLGKLLLKHPVNIWHFSESLDLGPPQSLMGSKIVPAMSTKLSRMFPMGSAVLVTPSFLVSEPQAAYKFFKWFFDRKSKHGNNKLVVAYNIVDYLSELSHEKSLVRSKLEKDIWRFKSLLDIASERNKSALTDQDLEARQKTWLYMDWWLSQQVHNEIPFSDFNSAIFVDRSIDPHDEQSLVNWFGWWSMEHSHEYRKFYVLGSSSRTESDPVHTLTSRTSRKIPLARYSRSVVNDPDEAMRIALSKRGPSSTADSDFQSQYFHNDQNRIGPWLKTQDKGFFSKLYQSPVSWVDEKMAAHYGDAGMSFRTIEQWWNSVIPWTYGSYNTFIGFFYTVSEEWDPNDPPKTTKPVRHPWLAIWRPVDPHDKGGFYSHGRTELIIWDIRAGAELETTTSLQQKDLTWVQQVLISHIQQRAHEKNPNSFLDRVWLGGFQAHQSQLVSTEPDITAEFVTRLTATLKQTLPGSAHFLRMGGYRTVALRKGMEPFSAYTEVHNDADTDADTRIIFHPPSGSRDKQPKGSSVCINELFDAARVERLRHRTASTMIYTYPPTLTWYQKQVAEGRHFEHILVDEWDKVFALMGVDKSTSAPVSASDDRPSQVSGRKGSGSNIHSIAAYGTPVA